MYRTSQCWEAIFFLRFPTFGDTRTSSLSIIVLPNIGTQSCFSSCSIGIQGWILPSNTGTQVFLALPNIGTQGCGSLGQLLFGTLWAQDIGAIRDEALAYERVLAHGADEAVIMPVAVFKGDEAGATDTCDWVFARYAALGKELTKAVGAVRFLVARSEALTSERSVAVGAREALAVPRFVLVSYATGRDDLVALDAAGSKLLLVASGAVYLLLSRDERLGANGCLADDATEAFFMPLPRLVLHLLVTSPEDLGATIAAGCELSIVARAAVDLLHLATKLLVNKRH